MDSALGLVETRGLLASVVGADAALKAAVVTLKGLEKVGGGLTAVILTGEVAAMAAALSAAEAAASSLTGYCRIHLIPRLDSQVRPFLDLDGGGPAAPPATLPPTGDKAPSDPVYWETPRTAGPDEVVPLTGPDEILALAGTPDEARELLPTVTVASGEYPVEDSPAIFEVQAPGASAAEARGTEDRKDEARPAETPKTGERKPTATKAAKPAVKKSRKR